MPFHRPRARRSAHAMSKRQSILLIDDSPMIHDLVEAHLAPLQAELRCCLSGREGVEQAIQRPPEMILLDVDMPDMNGFAVCQELKQHPATAGVPIVFLTAADSPAQKIRGLELGAVDYLTKPFDGTELIIRIRSVLRTEMLIRMLETQTRTDALTGLVNRAGFLEALERSIHRSTQDPSYRFALLFMDLDHFKVVIDSIGHDVGDLLLARVALMLKECVRNRNVPPGQRAADVVSRLGGDEFTVLLSDVPSMQDVEQVVARVEAAMAAPVRIGEYEIPIQASIGIRFCESVSGTADELLRDSDLAMYAAKSSGRGKSMIFDEQMHHKIKHRLRLETDMRAALAERQFQLHYQPILCLDDGKLAGFEALIRWAHPRLGVISPVEFIPLAEDNGLILQIGEWVLHEACAQLAKWRKFFPHFPPLAMKVNLSKRQLVLADSVTRIIQIVRSHQLEPQAVHFELTESDVARDIDHLKQVILQMRQHGLMVWLDDFGTGVSSLGSLRQLPIQGLKIDRSFISCIEQNRESAAILHAILGMADNLGLQVIGEGVTNTQQVALLQALGCTYAQGFHFAKPMDHLHAQQYLMQCLSPRPAASPTPPAG
jgi:diguanylate cyclase (GGDEF)-like protein